MAAFEGPSRVYPSKRDVWLMVALWASTAGMVWAAGSVWFSDEPMAFRLIMVLVMLASAALVGSLLYMTGYWMTSDQLVIRSGPFSWRVPLRSIHEVVPSRSLLSGPALSLDRLHVRYGSSKWGVLISPAEKDDFLREMVLRAPGLVRDGDRLVSSGD